MPPTRPDSPVVHWQVRIKDADEAKKSWRAGPLPAWRMEQDLRAEGASCQRMAKRTGSDIEDQVEPRRLSLVPFECFDSLPCQFWPMSVSAKSSRSGGNWKEPGRCSRFRAFQGRRDPVEGASLPVMQPSRLVSDWGVFLRARLLYPSIGASFGSPPSSESAFAIFGWL